MKIEKLTDRMVKKIIKKYGNVEDQELCEIYVDAQQARKEGNETAMRSQCEQFVEWEKRRMEAGL